MTQYNTLNVKLTNSQLNPLMIALLRSCLIFLKFYVLDNFRLIIS